MFHFKVTIEVFHDDREIEFIQFSRWLQRLFNEDVVQLDYKSCEMIADDMIIEIRKRYGTNRDVVIEVSEDNENGCVVTYPGS
jgi:tRNA isopentenyl-2-thiomethyl-A-37 hydroxylase MiaE